MGDPLCPPRRLGSSSSENDESNEDFPRLPPLRPPLVALAPTVVLPHAWLSFVPVAEVQSLTPSLSPLLEEYSIKVSGAPLLCCPSPVQGEEQAGER